MGNCIPEVSHVSAFQTGANRFPVDDFDFFLVLSKLLGCKQKIIDLLPKIEVALNNIKEADSSVMQMQGKRQREIWHLLKIACVSVPSLVPEAMASPSVGLQCAPRDSSGSASSSLQELTEIWIRGLQEATDRIAPQGLCALISLWLPAVTRV